MKAMEVLQEFLGPGFDVKFQWTTVEHPDIVISTECNPPPEAGQYITWSNYPAGVSIHPSFDHDKYWDSRIFFKKGKNTGPRKYRESLSAARGRKCMIGCHDTKVWIYCGGDLALKTDLKDPESIPKIKKVMRIDG